MIPTEAEYAIYRLRFVELADGWHWSQQTSFGCETLKECWKLVRQSEYDSLFVEELKKH